MARELASKVVNIRGKDITFTFLSTKDAVVILPVTEQGKVVLVRQIRPAVDEVLLELPAGGIENGEDPLKAAHRELAEETGYAARSLELTWQFYPSPGVSNEKMYLYHAVVNEKADQFLDDGEDIAVEEYTPEEAWNLVLTGEIRDAKTILGLARLQLDYTQSKSS